MADRDAAARLRAFARGQDGAVRAVINHVGRVGARVVAFGPSGEFGDVLVSSVEAAEALCGELGITVGEWDRETSAALAPTHEDRVRMGNRQR